MYFPHKSSTFICSKMNCSNYLDICPFTIPGAVEATLIGPAISLQQSKVALNFKGRYLKLEIYA